MINILLFVFRNQLRRTVRQTHGPCWQNTKWKQRDSSGISPISIISCSDPPLYMALGIKTDSVRCLKIKLLVYWLKLMHLIILVRKGYSIAYVGVSMCIVYNLLAKQLISNKRLIKMRYALYIHSNVLDEIFSSQHLTCLTRYEITFNYN